jgi:hypothetical protein
MTAKTSIPFAAFALGLIAALLVAAPVQAQACGNAAPYLRSVQVTQANCTLGKAVARSVWRRQVSCLPHDAGHTMTAGCQFGGWRCMSRRLPRRPSFAVRCNRRQAQVTFVVTF